MSGNINEPINSNKGNIIRFPVLSSILFHSFTEFLFEEPPKKWLPIGLIKGIRKDEKTYALLTNYTDFWYHACTSRYTNIPVVPVELKEINDEVLKEFDTLLPFTKFTEKLPSPYTLAEIPTKTLMSEQKIWEVLDELIDYIDCIGFDFKIGIW